MDPRAQEVLDFWFGPAGSPVHGSQRTEWFAKDDGFDALIGQRFGGLVDAALAGGLRDWDAQAEGALARILVLDQFTRNSARGTPRAFAGDRQALEAARSLVDAGTDRLLTPLQRSFAYLPFEHAEDTAMQDQALRLFTALAGEAPDLAGMVEYARRHREIVVRFGRFPHRNGVLGRPSSAEETAFLQQPGSRF